jgi:uncharacterized protein affecting Mg2+/Co2+ transport
MRRSIHAWAYEVRVMMDPSAALVRAQLVNRRWEITGDGKTDVVEGPGVIGLTPVIEAGCPAFAYCSQVTLHHPPGASPSSCGACSAVASVAFLLRCCVYVGYRRCSRL